MSSSGSTVRFTRITKDHINRILKVFSIAKDGSEDELGYRKVRSVSGIGFEQKYEYYTCDLNTREWTRVRTSQYCDLEGFEYERVSRLAWVVLFGKYQEEKVTAKDVAKEQGAGPVKEIELTDADGKPLLDDDGKVKKVRPKVVDNGPPCVQSPWGM